MEAGKKVSMLVYATSEERERIKAPAAKMNLSVSKFMLECVMEQVASIEELMQRTGEHD